MTVRRNSPIIIIKVSEGVWYIMGGTWLRREELENLGARFDATIWTHRYEGHTLPQGLIDLADFYCSDAVEIKHETE